MMALFHVGASVSVFGTVHDVSLAWLTAAIIHVFSYT